MGQYNAREDTIAAIATPAGVGGLGIVRLSGPRAFAVADRIFAGKHGGKPSSFAPFTAHYGQVFRQDNAGNIATVDEALCVVMAGPKSYTREDVVEISCHGGTMVLRAVLDLAVSNGARLAEPGEFTKRAFLNGRIDLAQAEAVLDIIHSRSDNFLRVSQNQLKGDLSVELENIRECLMAVYVELEARLNFPDDDPPAATADPGWPRLDQARAAIAKLLASADQGKLWRDGVTAVLCGRPNVGKSSLLNLLLRQDRAIVSHVAGTTRDTIEESIQIDGVLFRLIDTAGLLAGRDSIEEEAVRRSRAAIAAADLILFLIDASEPLTPEDFELYAAAGARPGLVVLNKCDRGRPETIRQMTQRAAGKPAVQISALTGEGLENLEQRILGLVDQGTPLAAGEVLVTNLRHVASLRQAQEALEAVQQNLSPEFVAEQIKTAVNALDNVTGRSVDADLVEAIFTKFCVGK
ncbi:MAG: tRNA uridine-5-carboxymethylaminomethyl(34) synthesis GTPase MnmE [Candidatus Omnitrophica bacterium]|nr:tRNA uridine-5-carboxymethylaminomethyl(34) synthesis GTPase MnmE [Candidatus Omnitrophota bacterium]